MKTALTIAGSDSSGGGGIQADLRTFGAHGVYGLCAVTAVTAQNTVGVTAVHEVPAALVVSQIETVLGDIRIGAAKTGMLASRATIEAVSACIQSSAIPSVVVDPVIASTSGTRFLPDDGIDALRTLLLPRACCVTPNREEAEVLAGRPIESVADARDVAQRIADFGAAAVVVTGGHLPTEDVIDVFFDGHEFVELRGPRHGDHVTRGTGCAFSAAVTAALARGQTLTDSVSTAKSFVSAAILRGARIGGGGYVMRDF